MHVSLVVEYVFMITYVFKCVLSGSISVYSPYSSSVNSFSYAFGHINISSSVMIKLLCLVSDCQEGI